MMAGHNIINPRYILANITHSYTLIKKGPGVQNIKTVKLFPLQVIGKTNILLLLQSNYNKFLIHRNYLGEIYTIN